VNVHIRNDYLCRLGKVGGCLNTRDESPNKGSQYPQKND
jgi:hypothetical protein